MYAVQKIMYCVTATTTAYVPIAGIYLIPIYVSTYSSTFTYLHCKSIYKIRYLYGRICLEEKNIYASIFIF